jgi:hypothetical protein
MTEGTPISYQAVTHGTPVTTKAGREFGTVDHVLEIPSEDLFDGVVVATADGIRFVDRDQILTITDRSITCDLDDAQAAALPAPDGPPVYSVSALDFEGHSVHDVLHRMFHRPGWKPKAD